MKNIADIKNCYGCGVCAIVCPEKIITIDLNSNGFYEAQIINETACTDCGLCVKVCAYVDDTVMSVKNSQPISYAAWTKDNGVRMACSSGGIGFEIGRHLIGQGYKAIGVRYNAEMKRAEHFLAITVEEFKPSIGSKYIQSYTLPGFEMVNRKDKFFITGTPCQIDSMRRYIRALKMEDNFVLMDFFCYGVPSMHLWQKYTQKVEQYTGKITSTAWRDKSKGWHDSLVMVIAGKKKKDYYSSWSDGDLFYRLFLGNLCMNEVCYHRCKYKRTSSAADIRIGDCWGKTYQEHEAGVSALLAFSAKGKSLVKQLTSCNMEPQPVSVVTEGQMRHGLKKPVGYRYVKRRLSEDADLSDIARKARLIRIVLNIHKILLRRFIKLWKML